MCEYCESPDFVEPLPRSLAVRWTFPVQPSGIQLVRYMMLNEQDYGYEIEWHNYREYPQNPENLRECPACGRELD